MAGRSKAAPTVSPMRWLGAVASRAQPLQGRHYMGTKGEGRLPCAQQALAMGYLWLLLGSLEGMGNLWLLCFQPVGMRTAWPGMWLGLCSSKGKRGLREGCPACMGTPRGIPWQGTGTPRWGRGSSPPQPYCASCRALPQPESGGACAKELLWHRRGTTPPGPEAGKWSCPLASSPAIAGPSASPSANSVGSQKSAESFIGSR